MRAVSFGILGDSWASGRKLDDLLVSQLKDHGVMATCESIGFPGASSKTILRKFAARPFTIQPDAVLLVAGLNDVIGYKGVRFYERNMMRLARAAKPSNCRLLVLDLPDIRLKDIKCGNSLVSLKRIVLRYAFHGGTTDILNEYRAALSRALALHFAASDYHLISCGVIERNYYKPDGIHLTADGRAKLAQNIGRQVATALLD